MVTDTPPDSLLHLCIKSILRVNVIHCKLQKGTLVSLVKLI